ncbi:unnamed protein product [Mytilus edulis]|uniref:Uncharacterized protein n=1 Tax=Mytilus edulis TaxID=6550 RepID=A0A8S3Q680_MYTED|nr:unnamed protein product [Mytilus edulis]
MSRSIYQTHPLIHQIPRPIYQTHPLIHQIPRLIYQTHPLIHQTHDKTDVQVDLPNTSTYSSDQNVDKTDVRVDLPNIHLLTRLLIKQMLRSIYQTHPLIHQTLDKTVVKVALPNIHVFIRFQGRSKTHPLIDQNVDKTDVNVDLPKTSTYSSDCKAVLPKHPLIDQTVYFLGQRNPDNEETKTV